MYIVGDAKVANTAVPNIRVYMSRLRRKKSLKNFAVLILTLLKFFLIFIKILSPILAICSISNS